MKTLNLEDIIWKESKYFIAQCLNVDISSFEKTKKKAIANLQKALELYFEDNNNLTDVISIKQVEIVNSAISYG